MGICCSTAPPSLPIRCHMAATPETPRTVRIGKCFVTFDGAVVEFFGFMTSIDSARFHVGTLRDIEIADRHLLGTAINVNAQTSARWQGVPSFEGSQRADFEQLIAEIHAARDAWPS